jgi:hypothetical protein
MKGRAGGYVAAMGARSRTSTCASVLVLAALLTGCTTGQPTSTSGWQSETDRVLGTALSGLGTARIVVEQEQRDGVFHSYAVVAATDAIETTGKEISSYQVAQPPDQLHQANKVVGDALDKATSLLVDVRVALASPGLTAQSASHLLDRIDAVRRELNKLDDAVMKDPGSVAAQ